MDCAEISSPSAVSATSWQARAAVLEQSGLPSEWAETVARLLIGPPPRGFDHSRWSRAVDGAVIFAEQWSGRAFALGWSADEAFGLDKIAPASRHDRKGLAWLLADGRRVTAIDAQGADIITAQGSRQRFYRMSDGAAQPEKGQIHGPRM